MHRLQRVLNGLVDRVDTPMPIVLADVMQRNIERMQGFAVEHDLDLRPHVKTHKCVEVGRRQVDAGAVGITAGNVGEAEVFAAAGFEDIFLAYPVWPSGTKGDRIRRLAQIARMRVGVDNAAAIDALADAMGDEPDRLQVVVEVECGARRSGAPPEAAGDLALIARKRGLVPVGVYTYPGHGSAGPGSREPAAQDQEAALSAAVRSFDRRRGHRPGGQRRLDTDVRVLDRGRDHRDPSRRVCVLRPGQHPARGVRGGPDRAVRGGHGGQRLGSRPGHPRCRHQSHGPRGHP